MRLHRYPGLFGSGAERTLWLAVFASALLHVGLFAAFGRFRIAPVERTFFAPLHMVELAPKPPGPAGGPKAAPQPAPPAPAPPPKPEAKPVPKAEKAPPPPTEAPKPQPKPPAATAKPEPKPTEKVVPLTPKEPSPPKETYTEEQVAQRIARLREKLGPQEPPAPAPAAPQTAMGDTKVRQAVESLRERLKPQEGTGGGGSPGPAGAVGVRAGGNVLQEVRLRAYYNRLWEHVNSHWTIPPSLEGRGYTVIVSVVLDRKGRILKTGVEEPSVSVAFDQSALRALERASPLPPFPDDVKEDVLEVGFRFHGE